MQDYKTWKQSYLEKLYNSSSWGSVNDRKGGRAEDVLAVFEAKNSAAVLNAAVNSPGFENALEATRRNLLDPQGRNISADPFFIKFNLQYGSFSNERFFGRGTKLLLLAAPPVGIGGVYAGAALSDPISPAHGAEAAKNFFDSHAGGMAAVLVSYYAALLLACVVQYCMNSGEKVNVPHPPSDSPPDNERITELQTDNRSSSTPAPYTITEFGGS